MKIYGKCKNCKAENGCNTNAKTRVEFAMKNGETKILNCRNCETNTEYQVDALYAKPSKIAKLFAGLIFVVGTPLVFFGINPIFIGSQNHYAIYFVGGFMLVPIFAYGIINKQEQARVNDFNRQKLKGRMHNIT